jgi:hypothetical protein
MKLKKLLIPFSFILSTLYLFSCGPNEPGDPPEHGRLYTSLFLMKKTDIQPIHRLFLQMV